MKGIIRYIGVMRIKTNGNMLLISGVQDSKEHVLEWQRLGPEAVEHARRALALHTGRAASVYADAFQYMRPGHSACGLGGHGLRSSAHGILRQALTGGGQEFLRNARRMQQEGPREEGDDLKMARLDGHSLCPTSDAYTCLRGCIWLKSLGLSFTVEYCRMF